MIHGCNATLLRVIRHTSVIDLMLTTPACFNDLSVSQAAATAKSDTSLKQLPLYGKLAKQPVSTMFCRVY